MCPAETKDVDANDPAVAVDESPDERPETADGGAAEPEATVAQTPDGSDQTAVEGGKADQVKKAEFQPVSATRATGSPAGIDLLMDVVLPVAIELGRTNMMVKDVLNLCPGSVIELDRAAGEPVDILASGKVLGRGEVVVLNDCFGVRVTELLNPVEGLAKE